MLVLCYLRENSSEVETTELSEKEW